MAPGSNNAKHGQLRARPEAYGDVRIEENTGGGMQEMNKGMTQANEATLSLSE
jgi:hypothetical protein